jgi:DNA-binding response OmpR family regulator
MKENIATRVPPGPPPSRILIVEENRDAAHTVGMLCEQMGHQCSFAYDGIAAVEMARRLQPHVVLLDFGLPRIDGFEVARQLRADPTLRGVLIIAVTGSGREEDRTRAQEIGIDHYLVKPADPRFLESLLRQRLR